MPEYAHASVRDTSNKNSGYVWSDAAATEPEHLAYCSEISLWLVLCRFHKATS